MFCTKCGHNLEEDVGVKFCISCGKPVRNALQTQQHGNSQPTSASPVKICKVRKPLYDAILIVAIAVTITIIIMVLTNGKCTP